MRQGRYDELPQLEILKTLAAGKKPGAAYPRSPGDQLDVHVDLTLDTAVSAAAANVLAQLHILRGEFHKRGHGHPRWRHRIVWSASSPTRFLNPWAPGVLSALEGPMSPSGLSGG